MSKVCAFSQWDQQSIIQALLPLVDAVAYLHESSIIHRDITPQNILLCGFHLVLIDFGFAAPFLYSDPPRTRGRVTMGGGFEHFEDLHLRPPEIDSKKWTGTWFPQSDVYYLGVIATIMAMGISPERKFEYWFRDSKSFINMFSANNKSLTKGFTEILVSALAKEKDNRFSNAREMFYALQKLH